MHTIGILGGMGPQATMRFERRIHEEASRRLPANWATGYPPMVVWYVREAPFADEGGMLAPSQGLLAGARWLGQAADFIVMTSNTPHKFAQEVSNAAGKPLLNMVELTIEEVTSRAPRLVGILAAGLAREDHHALYQSGLDREGVAWTTIPDEMAVRLDESIGKVMENADPGSVRGPADEAVAYLLAQGCDVIILGCTEIPLLLGDLAPAQAVDPAEILLEATLGLALGG